MQMHQPLTASLSEWRPGERARQEKDTWRQGPTLNTSSSDPQNITSILTIATSSETTVVSDFKLKRVKVPQTFTCVYM